MNESRDFASEVESGSWVLEWQSSKAFLEEAEVMGSAADVADHWTATLPHEIGHMLLEADFFPSGRPNALQGYGTPLPDWFDEAVAIWMEPDSVRQRRLVGARRNLDEVPPIGTLISIEHPLREVEVIRRETVTLYPCPRAEVCPDRPRWNEGIRITTWRDRMGQVHADTTYFQGMPPARDPTEEHFYPLAIGVLQYLLDRGGKGAIPALEDRLRTNPNSSEILLGLPGLPSETNALEEDWQLWWRRDLEQGSPGWG